MAFIRKVKPGELFKVPTGGYIKNNSRSAVSMIYLTEEEVTKSLITDDNQTQIEVKNENEQSKK